MRTIPPLRSRTSSMAPKLSMIAELNLCSSFISSSAPALFSTADIIPSELTFCVINAPAPASSIDFFLADARQECSIHNDIISKLLPGETATQVSAEGEPMAVLVLLKSSEDAAKVLYRDKEWETLAHEIDLAW